MSFGFSPGDIVIFTQFAAKAISSLREEGGSKSEFQLAERQCRAFLSVMDELQSLDLSNLPDSFRNKLDEYSTNVHEFINDFRKTIERYERSMGESSEHGSIRSAPRKVQWAFMAADDLGKFRQSLAAQLDLVKITIQTSILSIVAHHNQPKPPPTGLSQSLMWSGGAYQSTHRMQQYIDWNPISLDGNDLFRRVDDLTDLVYERLLTRPNIQLQSRGRIHTIPDDCSLNIPPPQLDPIREGQILQPIGDLIEPPISSGRGAVESTGIEDRNHDTLASEINEYLLSMNLEELSEHEREYMSRINSGSRHFLIDQPMEETAESHRQGHDGTSGQPQPSNAQGSSQQNAHFSSSKRSSWSFGTDPLDALSLAASIIQFVDFAAKISFKLTSAYRHTSDSPRELQDLSKRLMQYSGLLRTAAEVVRTSMPTGELQEIGWKILEDSRQTMKGVESLLDKYRIRPGQRLVSAFRALQWQSAKKNVGAIMEEVESLKSTLSVMLQLHQITMTENQIQMAEERSFEITKLY